MDSGRPFALVRTRDQWLRCAHTSTAIDAEHGFIELSTVDDESETSSGTEPVALAGGLAFDAHCRLYRSDAARGRVESLLWNPQTSPAHSTPSVTELFPAAPASLGDFTNPESGSGSLVQPRGIGITPSGLLYIAEAGRNRVLVYDLFERRLLAIVPMAPEGTAGPSPIDVAAFGERVFVLTERPARVIALLRGAVVGERQLPIGVVVPSRLAASPRGRLALLDSGSHRVLLVGEDLARDVSEHATDLEFEDESTIVVASYPGEDFLRHTVQGPSPTRRQLRARGYDGLGITRTPDGRIAFWTDRGLRTARQDRPVYAATGTVTTFRLDSGEWQTQWGRIFIDACLPDGTSLQVFCAAADEPPEDSELSRTPPANFTSADVVYPEQSPPMPPLSLLPADHSQFQDLHRRSTGRELPWAPPANDKFATFEAPILTAPGRYLWVQLRLSGTTKLTPKVQCIRAEHPGHDTLRHLPKVFSREPTMASFLRRYLAPLAGLISELDGKAFERAVLLDPHATPEDALAWLANFVGLALDDRWARAPRFGAVPDDAEWACDSLLQSKTAALGRYTVDARRELIRNASCLFRLRGTVEGLRRFIEIYAARTPVILERFRVRGLGGAVLGETSAAFSSGMVGTLRVGGAISPETAPTDGRTADAFRTHAHRFSVIMPDLFGDEELDVIRHIVELQRPAHTLFQLCTVGAGMRLGHGAHLGLSSFVGRRSGFQPWRVGSALVGPNHVVGRAQPAVRFSSRGGSP